MSLKTVLELLLHASGATWPRLPKISIYSINLGHGIIPELTGGM
jgi:hypothetical protein